MEDKKKNNGGRPTKYKEEFVEQGKFLTKKGATDAELAQFFKVKEQTINNWKDDHPEFFESIKAGKEFYDNGQVENALLQRALGYSHEDVHISNFRGDITITDIIKHYPPDTRALELWLTNRDSNRWQNKKHLEITKPLDDSDIDEILDADD